MELFDSEYLAPDMVAEAGGFACLSLRLKISRAFTELRNILAILRGRPTRFWEESYKAGYWTFLKDRSQRPRHYAVAGLIQDLAPKKPEILEIGCGYAPVLNLLPTGEFSYLGIDYSRELIRQNQEKLAAPGIEFHQAELPSEEIFGDFDVIVASEVLYYFPLRHLGSITSHLLRQLKPDGFLIVTMNKNPKAWFVWRILDRLARRMEKTILQNESGSRWTVCVYRAGPEKLKFPSQIEAKIKENQ